jgi:hypothetical protein
MRTRILSSLLVGGLCTMLAVGQTPPPPPPKKAEPEKAAPKKVELPKELTLEEATAYALQNHPDVRVSAAEVELAQAKLQKVKQAVGERVAEAKVKIESTKEILRANIKSHDVSKEAYEKVSKQLAAMRALGQAVAPLELAQMEITLDRYKSNVTECEKNTTADRANLTKAEAEYTALVGSTRTAKNDINNGMFYDITFVGDRVDDNIVFSNGIWYRRTHSLEIQPAKVVIGPFKEQLAAALDKRIKFEVPKAVPADEMFAQLLKIAKVDGTVRIPFWDRANEGRATLKLDFPVSEVSITSVMEELLDEINQLLSVLPDKHAKRYELYVREYGLLLADASNPPSDAITFSNFAKQVRAEKAAAKEKSK